MTEQNARHVETLRHIRYVLFGDERGSAPNAPCIGDTLWADHGLTLKDYIDAAIEREGTLPLPLDAPSSSQAAGGVTGVSKLIETWARRLCSLRGIDPDEDWRVSAEGPMLDVAVRDEDRPQWRHLYGKPAEQLLRDFVSLGGPDKDSQPIDGGARAFVEFVLRHTLPERAHATGLEALHNIIKFHPFAKEALSLPAKTPWRDMDDPELAKVKEAETPVLLYRECAGWRVLGWGYWADVNGIDGWITHGFSDPPGNLGLGHPDKWMPIQPPPQAESP